MKSLYFSFIHSYLTYGNVAWCSTSMSGIKKLFSKQKQALKIIQMTDKHAHLNSDKNMKHLDILNICNLNVYEILNTMFRVKTNSIPEILQNEFKVIEHNYFTRHSEYNFQEPNIFLGLICNIITSITSLE